MLKRIVQKWVLILGAKPNPANLGANPGSLSEVSRPDPLPWKLIGVNNLPWHLLTPVLNQCQQPLRNKRII